MRNSKTFSLFLYCKPLEQGWCMVMCTTTLYQVCWKGGAGWWTNKELFYNSEGCAHLFVCVWQGEPVPQHTCGGHRTTFRGQFSPPTMWIPGTELELSIRTALSHWAVLLAPVFIILRWRQIEGGQLCLEIPGVIKERHLIKHSGFYIKEKEERRKENLIIALFTNLFRHRWEPNELILGSCLAKCLVPGKHSISVSE